MGQRRGQRTIWRSTEGLGWTTQSVRRAGQEDPLHFFPSKRTVSGRYKAKTKKIFFSGSREINRKRKKPSPFSLKCPMNIHRNVHCYPETTVQNPDSGNSSPSSAVHQRPRTPDTTLLFQNDPSPFSLFESSLAFP